MITIELLSERQQDAMRRVGRVAAQTLAQVGAELGPGTTTLDIDRRVRELTAAVGGTPSQLGYHGFPASVCTSVNQVVCHGIPSAKAVLRDGDIVNVDVTTCLDGHHGDTSTTFVIGAASAEARRLVEVAERCRAAGIAEVGPGARLGDVGAAIQAVAQAAGCSVVTEYGGHGIGRHMHQPPDILYMGPAGRGLRLRAGMAITIEPMINLGGPEVTLLDDGWTVVTADGALSAQFEHTVLVTAAGHEVLTR